MAVAQHDHRKIDPLEQETIKRVAWRLLPILVLGYFAAYLDRVNVGMAAPTMMPDLKFTSAIFGFGAGLFFIGYTAAEIPSNLILDKTGARRWIARILITWGLLSCMTAFVWNDLSFYVFRFVLGIAEAGFFPGVMLYLTWWFPSLLSVPHGRGILFGQHRLADHRAAHRRFVAAHEWIAWVARLAVAVRESRRFRRSSCRL